MGTFTPPNSDMSGFVERHRTLITKPGVYGLFGLEQFRVNPRTGLYESIGIHPFPNGATNTGKQYLLSAGFLGGTPITTWYLGLIDGTSGTPTLNDGDSPTSHGGWTEFTNYNETVRQTWTAALNTGTNQVISSASASFTVSNAVGANAYLAGGFLASSSVKGGATGTLWATGTFPNPVPIQAGDIFKQNYVTGL